MYVPVRLHSIKDNGNKEKNDLLQKKRKRNICKSICSFLIRQLVVMAVMQQTVMKVQITG